MSSGFDLASLRVDKDKEVEGVEMEYANECMLLIARIKNPKYQARFYDLQSKALTRRGGTTRLEDAYKSHIEITRQCIAEFCLLGWTNLFMDGEEIPYSQEKALEILTDFPEFADDVAAMAGDREAFKLETQEESSGNSKVSSSGTPTGAGT